MAKIFETWGVDAKKDEEFIRSFLRMVDLEDTIQEVRLIQYLTMVPKVVSHMKEHAPNGRMMKICLAYQVVGVACAVATEDTQMLMLLRVEVLKYAKQKMAILCG